MFPLLHLSPEISAMLIDLAQEIALFKKKKIVTGENRYSYKTKSLLRLNAIVQHMKHNTLNFLSASDIRFWVLPVNCVCMNS